MDLSEKLLRLKPEAMSGEEWQIRLELAALYRSLKATGLVDFRDAGLSDNVTYWTSSQQTTDMANHIDFADAGRPHYDDKDFPRRVRCATPSAREARASERDRGVVPRSRRGGSSGGRRR